MKTQQYATFKKNFAKMAVLGFLISALSLTLSITASKYDYSIISTIFVILFISSIIFLFIYPRYIIKNVNCPDCNIKCKTTEDKKRSLWIATCFTCNTHWELGVGSKTDSNIT